MTHRKMTITLLLALTLLLLSACGASIDASKARSRGTINRGDIVRAADVHVAEYLNYYEQRFPAPTTLPLAMDIRLGNTSVPSQGGDVWVQIGLQAKQASATGRTPLNLALVLDTSGSMAADAKMDYLKQSLDLFLHSLQPDDIIAIVAYSDEAHLLLPAQRVDDGRWIQATIHNLQPDGWTNLYAGLMMGFQEVEKHYDMRRNNRVILLTDGIANRGATRASEIAVQARNYNTHNIYLSTIGLGSSVDEDLLRTLAYQGHGAYHFIDSPAEMNKVFAKEVDGLVEKVAKSINIALEAENGNLQYLVGFGGDVPHQGAKVLLPDMGTGENQVVLAKFHVWRCDKSKALARVTLTYDDVFAQKQRSETRTITIYPGRAADTPLADIEVRRNVTIVRSAEAIKRIDFLFQNARYAEARDLAHEMEQDLRAMAAITGDVQLIEDADLFRRYQITLTTDQDDAGRQYSTGPQQPQRWGTTAPTPTLPEISIEQ